LTIDDASARVGCVQLRLDYSLAPGQFAGTGTSGICIPQNGPEGLFAMNDVDAERVLRLAFVMPSGGISAPHSLATCFFTEGDLENPPVAEDFQVVVEDACAPDSSPIEVTIGLAVVPPAP
jgi:hypothetical protein